MKQLIFLKSASKKENLGKIMHNETLIMPLFEGVDWIELYSRNSDPFFVPEKVEINGHILPLFHGKISLSFWLKTTIPLPSIAVTFWGSPITDLFPLRNKILNDSDEAEAVETVIQKAVERKSWAVVVKDLPIGDPLEKTLMESGFIPVEHDPVWYMPVHKDLQTCLNGLSKGRRRGIEGRWKKFNKLVSVRTAVMNDAEFIKNSYDMIWQKSDMRLEKLTKGFFAEALAHPSSKVFIFERDGMPFGFIMLWQNGSIWFDKYMGTDSSIYREVSFYSMSILYLLKIAPSYGVNLYVAGQGCGKDKEGLGFKPIYVRLWIKPLFLTHILSPMLKRFIKVHSNRIFADN